MERDGYIAGTTSSKDRRPDKRDFELTASRRAGRGERGRAAAALYGVNFTVMTSPSRIA